MSQRQMFAVRLATLAALAIGLWCWTASAPLYGAERDPVPPPAWQSGDPTLALIWRQLTGRYIFEVACTSCHAWGPNHWSRSRWESYLKEFPANHQPDVRNRYCDLTAMFDVGKMVPTKEQERDALTMFLVSASPSKELSTEERERKFHGAPEVGGAAPDFSVTDIQGRRFTLADLKGKKPLVLIFSRAHW